MGAGSVDIDESSQERRCGDLRPCDDIVHKGSEFCVFGTLGEGTTPRRRGRGTTHGKVHSFDYTVDDVFYRSTNEKCKGKLGEKECSPMTGREILMSISSRTSGECVAGSTRLAWWTGEEEEEAVDDGDESIDGE